MQTKTLNNYQRVWSFLKLTRLPFLLGGFLLYGLGAAAARRAGISLNWAAYLLGQGMITSTQLMAQYSNEYFDVEVDRLTPENRTWFSGGSGILSAGTISPATVLAATRICAAIAILTGILASFRSPWIIPIGIFCLLGSWFYSAPPVALMSSGWGEFTTSLIVGMLVPLAACCIQGGLVPTELWLVSIPLVLVHAAMLVSFEFPDYSADLAVGKRTLAVRLGLPGAAWAVDLLIASAFLFLGILSLISRFPGQWMAFALPLAIAQIILIHRVISSPTRLLYHLLTVAGVGLFGLMALFALLGVVFIG
jgi:1,4-dihydroxy-2-naphthoate polyprenyltransferase